MINSILVAIDVGHPINEAVVLKHAHELAELKGAQLDVVTVVPDYGTSLVSAFFDSSQHDALVEQVRDKLHALCAEVLGREANDKARHLVATGSVYEQVLKAAKTAGSDLIIIGAHKPDFKDYLLGPNAARVVRHAECSVYVVRA